MDWINVLSLWKSRDKEGVYNGTMRVDGRDQKVFVRLNKNPENNRPNVSISIPPETAQDEDRAAVAPPVDPTEDEDLF